MRHGLAQISDHPCDAPPPLLEPALQAVTPPLAMRVRARPWLGAPAVRNQQRRGRRAREPRRPLEAGTRALREPALLVELEVGLLGGVFVVDFVDGRRVALLMGLDL